MTVKKWIVVIKNYIKYGHYIARYQDKYVVRTISESAISNFDILHWDKRHWSDYCLFNTCEEAWTFMKNYKDRYKKRRKNMNNERKNVN